MKGVFLSYRIDDTKPWAGRLAETIQKLLGPDIPVFRDVEDIPAGGLWAEKIQSAINSSDVFLILIGPQWLAELEGKRRIDDIHDVHRLEIEAALDRSDRRLAYTVPVLVNGAQLPSQDDLPKSLQPLLNRQAIEVSDRDWETDCKRMLEACQKETEQFDASGNNDTMQEYGDEVVDSNSPIQTSLVQLQTINFKTITAAVFMLAAGVLVVWGLVSNPTVNPNTTFNPTKDTNQNQQPATVPPLVQSEQVPVKHSQRQEDQDQYEKSAHNEAEQEALEDKRKRKKIEDAENDARLLTAEAEKAEAIKRIKDATIKQEMPKEHTQADTAKQAPRTNSVSISDQPTKTTSQRQVTPRELKELKQKAAAGDRDAQVRLGLIQINNGNTTDALKLFQQAATNGHAGASFELGNAMLKGIGIEKNETAAIEHFERASNRGDMRATRELGISYLEGRGVPQNKEKAIELLKTAARKKDVQAQKFLIKLNLLY